MSTLRGLRMAAGLTQEQAAAALGVPRSTYAVWETGRADRGRVTPPVSKLRPLAELFHVPVELVLDAVTTEKEAAG